MDETSVERDVDVRAVAAGRLHPVEHLPVPLEGVLNGRLGAVEEEIVHVDFPQDREQEISDLRRSLFVKDDSTVLLMVSICTDEMIKLVAMHPEVW